jgi:DNA sulfur modification protein DndE
MSFKITTSESSREIVSTLTSKLNLGAENVIARLAFAYSINKDDDNVLTLGEQKDSKGKQYSSGVLFGDYYPYYVAILCNKYQIHKSNKDISKYVKLHVDNGLQEMNELTNKRGMDFLIDAIEEGLNEF